MVFWRWWSLERLLLHRHAIRLHLHIHRERLLLDLLLHWHTIHGQVFLHAWFNLAFLFVWAVFFIRTIILFLHLHSIESGTNLGIKLVHVRLSLSIFLNRSSALHLFRFDSCSKRILIKFHRLLLWFFGLTHLFLHSWHHVAHDRQFRWTSTFFRFCTVQC